MKESCGCGASVDAETVDLVREWRTEHRHEAPPLKQSPSGGYATTSIGYNPIGFSVPEQTNAMRVPGHAGQGRVT